MIQTMACFEPWYVIEEPTNRQIIAPDVQKSIDVVLEDAGIYYKIIPVIAAICALVCILPEVITSYIIMKNDCYTQHGSRFLKCCYAFTTVMKLIITSLGIIAITGFSLNIKEFNNSRTENVEEEIYEWRDIPDIRKNNGFFLMLAATSFQFVQFFFCLFCTVLYSC